MMEDISLKIFSLYYNWAGHHPIMIMWLLMHVCKNTCMKLCHS